MATFGKTTPGATGFAGFSMGNAAVYTCRFVAPEWGTITEIVIPLYWGVFPRAIIGLIYSDDGLGNPARLLAVSPPVTQTSGSSSAIPASWVRFPINLAIEGGKTYHLGICTYNSMWAFSDAGAINQTNQDGIDVYPNPPADFGTPRNRYAIELTIYAEYTPTMPPDMYTLTIQTTTGGSTNPMPATYVNIVTGTAVLVSAIPNAGYKFDYWESDNSLINGSTSPDISILVDNNYFVRAVFSLLPTYTISGRVTDNMGAPLANVTVRANSAPPTATGSTGAYTLLNLPAGIYTVSFTLQGYTSTSITVDISIGDALNANAIMNPLPANTIIAQSGSFTDIQVAVNSLGVVDGTVIIPSGSFDFGEGTVLSRGGINFKGDADPPTGKGAGAIRTALILPPNGTVDRIMFSIDGANQRPVVFEGINFVGRTAPNSPTGDAAIDHDNVKDFRVSNCRFELLGGSGVSTWNSQIANGLKCQGVADHCSFIDMYKPAALTAGRGYAYGVAPGRVWSLAGQPFEPDISKILGTATNVIFVEDCYFQNTRHCVAATAGAHYVFRHNEVHYPTVPIPYDFHQVDAHGTYFVQNLGTRCMEVYENVFYDESLESSRAIYWRGGGGVAFNNTMYDYYTAIRLANEPMTGDAALNEQSRTKDIWLWNNSPVRTSNPVEVSSSVVQGRDFWLTAPPFTYTPYPYPHPLTLLPLTHTLIVDTTPIQGVPFTIETTPKVTPWSSMLNEGTYNVTMPAVFTDLNGQKWYFKYWSDDHANTNPVRTIALLSDMNIVAVYELTPIPPSISLVKVAAVTAAIVVPISGAALYMRNKKEGVK